MDRWTRLVKLKIKIIELKGISISIVLIYDFFFVLLGSTTTTMLHIFEFS